MTERSTAPHSSSGPSTWSRIPNAYKFGGAIAVLGFFVNVTSSSTTTKNGVETSSSYFNLAALIWGVIALVAAVAGILENRKAHPGARLSPPLLFGGAGVLAVLGVIHLLRAFGTIGGAS